MADVEIDLTKTGGSAVVILAKDFDLPSDYALHPQVISILASDLPHQQDELNAKIPSTTKIVFIVGEILATKFGMLRAVLTRRGLTYLQRRNEPALGDALQKCLPLKKYSTDTSTNGNGKVEEPIKRGSVSELARMADLGKGSAEEARRLMKVAQERGIRTTVASLAQAVGMLKRKGGRTETPKSLMTAQQKALITLDEAIAALQLIREYVSETEALNLELTSKLNQFKSILG